MPVNVPTADEFTTLQHQVAELEARVIALESEAPPIDPEEPPPDIEEPPDEIEEPPPDLIPPDRDDMRAIIRLGGQDYEYDAAAGTNIGAFQDCIGPMVGQGRRFAMSCHRVERDDCPIRVDFRAVSGLDWWCAIFDYGNCWGEGGASNLTGPIFVGIGGATIELFGHPWGSRWRWQSGPWPFPLVMPQAIFDAKLLLPFDPEAPHGTAPEGFTAAYEPLGMAGITPYMPQTGERQEIGYVTDMQAQWLCGATGHEGVLAQGEAAGTVPWRLYDPARGRTVDALVEYPNICLEGGSPSIVLQCATTFEVDLEGPPGAGLPSPMTLRTPDGQQFDCSCWSTGTLDGQGKFRAVYSQHGWGSTCPYGGTFVGGMPEGMSGTVAEGTWLPSSGCYPESGHMPALAYVPYLITGDPYHLENLHSQVVFAFVEYNRGWPNTYTPGIIQPRGAAWNFRSIFQAAAVTPEDAPPWLLPKSVMDAALAHCVKGMTEEMANPPCGPVQSVCCEINPTNSSNKAGWQMDFYVLVSAAATALHEEWRPIMKWVADHVIARISGKSGWGRGYPDPYNIYYATEGDYGPPWCETWDQMWTRNTGGDAASAAASELKESGPEHGMGDYLNGMLAALRALTHVLPKDDPQRHEVDDCLDYLEHYHTGWLGNGSLRMEYKWAISSNA